jgi:hypothetical protein
MLRGQVLEASSPMPNHTRCICGPFEAALRPVFERSGLEWQPPPISVSQVGMVFVFVILGVVAVFVALVILLTAFLLHGSNW